MVPIQAQKWEDEELRIATKANKEAMWTAILLVPTHIFTTDFLDDSSKFTPESIFLRLLVPGILLSILFLTKYISLKPKVISFLLMSIVSLSDSYMASKSGKEALVTHLLGYGVVFIGGNMLMFWKVKDALLAMIISLIISGIFFFYNSSLTFLEILAQGGAFIFFITILSAILLFIRYRYAENAFYIQQELIVKSEEIKYQRDEISKKNKDITGSINYAQRIQKALLPELEQISNILPDSFVLLKPRDIVSGDFFWFTQKDDLIILAAVDCTGHGVPGAFMSIIGSNLLDNIVREKGITQPDEILNQLHEGVVKALKQKETGNKDGMDLSICVINKKNNKIDFAGAKNELTIIQNGSLQIIKADKNPIGGKHKVDSVNFSRHTIEIEKDCYLYLFSDGYQDQFGGVEGRKFMSKRFQELLLDIHRKPLIEQKKILEETINKWMENGYKQIDDIMVVGVKVS